MHRSIGKVLFLACTALVLAAVPAAAQVQIATNVVAQMPPAWRHAFAVDAGTVQHLQVPAAPVQQAAIDVVLAGRPFTIDLVPFEVRSASFQLFARTNAGLVSLPAPSATTWRGTVLGDAGSEVAATLDGGSLRAYVRKGDGQLWVVQPLADAIAGAPAAMHAVFRGSDGAVTNGRCGVVGGPVRVPAPGIGGDVVYECELALEADFPLYQWNGGSVANTQNDVLGIVNAVDLIFRTDVQVHFTVTQLIVDTAVDAYATSVASSLLSQVQNQWNGTWGAFARDVVHLFSGRQIGAASAGTIGIAYVGTVCDTASAYGLSETHWSANYAYRVAVTAHELGHNFNATHCDGQPSCSLMCSVVGGCSGNTSSFSAPEQAQILAFRQTATCLVAQATPPQIASATPSQVATVNPGIVVLGGTGFFGTTAVTVGSQQVTAGITVLSDTQLRFPAPPGMPLGGQPLTVTNPAGTSNAVVLTYNASDPCQLVVPSATYGGAFFQWRMGGWPNDFAFLGISVMNTTSPWLGQPLVDGFLLIWSGGLDAQGLANFAVTVPTGLLAGFTVYSQLLDVDLSTVTLRSVSSIPGSWIVF
jgi:hypothetical protein